MAPLTRPFSATGVALVSAAAICTAAPAVVPGQIAGLPSVSTAQYRLAAAKLQVPDLFVISQVGYGNFIGPDDPYFPGEFNNDVKVTGPAGLAYYVVDQVLKDPYNLENYFFEVGAKSSNAIAGGLAAVAYVQTAALFGIDNVITQTVKAAVTGGNIGAAVGSAITTTISSLLYKIPVLGPIASVYITGKAPGDSTVYGTGINGVIEYAKKLIPTLGFLLGPPRPAAAALQAKVASTADAVDVADTAPVASEEPAVDAAPVSEVTDTVTAPKAAAARKAKARVAAQVATPSSDAGQVPTTPSAHEASEPSEAPEAHEVAEAPEVPEAAETPEAPEAPEAEHVDKVETPATAADAQAPAATAPAAVTSANRARSVAPKRTTVRSQLQAAAKSAQAAHAAKRAKAGRVG